MNCHLKRTLKTGHSHTFIEHLLCSGGSDVSAEKNGVLVFKALAGPCGKQTNQINFKITQEVPQIPSVQTTSNPK